MQVQMRVKAYYLIEEILIHIVIQNLDSSSLSYIFQKWGRSLDWIRVTSTILNCECFMLDPLLSSWKLLQICEISREAENLMF